MKKLTNIPILVFVLMAVVIVASSLLAKDWHKNDYLQWERMYTEIEQSTILISNAMLKMQNGFASSTEQLTNRTALLAVQLEQLLNKFERTMTAGFWERFVLLSPEIDTLHTLGESYISSAKDFGTNAMLLGHAREAALSTTAKMREVEVTNVDAWQEFLDQAERQLTGGPAMDPQAGKERLSYIVNRMTLQNRSRQELMHLEALGKHARDIEAHGPAVERNFASHLRLERMLAEEIGRLRVRTASLYAETIKKGETAELSLALLVFFVLVYGSYFALRTTSFKRQMQDSDRGLAFSVKATTGELERRIELLNRQCEAGQTEVCELQKKNAHIQERETFFRTLVDSASSPILLIDQNLFIRFSNPAAHELFDYGESEFRNLPISGHIPAIESTSGLDTSRPFMVTGITRSGVSLSLKVAASQIPAAPGAAARYVLILNEERESGSYQKSA